MIYSDKGTKNMDTETKRKEKFCISDQEVLTLAKWGCAIEKHYSDKKDKYVPMDIEWAKDGNSGELYIVQARPETVQSRKDYNTLIEYQLKGKKQDAEKFKEEYEEEEDDDKEDAQVKKDLGKVKEKASDSKDKPKSKGDDKDKAKSKDDKDKDSKSKGDKGKESKAKDDKKKSEGESKDKDNGKTVGIDLLKMVQRRREEFHKDDEEDSDEDNSDSEKKKIHKNEDEEVLTSGAAVGASIAVGAARIIPSIDELDEFKKGEILITEMTDPDWEPILKHAAGIVTNSGGRTCHAAIIARELGIPCIVGCGDATSVIENDQGITLDCSRGDHGVVLSGIYDFEVCIITDHLIRNGPLPLFIQSV